MATSDDVGFVPALGKWTLPGGALKSVPPLRKGEFAPRFTLPPEDTDEPAPAAAERPEDAAEWFDEPAEWLDEVPDDEPAAEWLALPELPALPALWLEPLDELDELADEPAL